MKGAAGTPGPEGTFSDSFTPTAGVYDLWYRVRVANHSGHIPEMVLTLVDMDAGSYVASATVRPDEARTTYSWVRVAPNLDLSKTHQMRFQTNIAAKLSTDWFVDEAALVPAGESMPPRA